MPAVPPVVLPYDPTGAAATNLVTGEVHDLSGQGGRAFVLDYGPFYVQNLVVTNVATGQPLSPQTPQQPNGQYVATQIFIDETLKTGLDICSVIVITDSTLPTDLQVAVTYQALGGQYSSSVDAIQQLIDALQLGNQPVLWADIVGKPILFPPTPHLHDLGDIYGFEYLVAALERLIQAIYVGDAAQLQAIYQYIDHEVDTLNSSISAVDAELTAHEADFNNPHRVTKAQVALGNVDNFATATAEQAQQGTASNLFMTPATTAAAISSQAGSALAAHIADHNNPHQTTAAQVGSYTTTQVDSSVANLQAQITNLSNTKQNNLGFTPVRQGGGLNQLTNTIYIGYSSGGPRLTVDATDFGPFSFQGHTHVESDVANLVNDLNARPTLATVQSLIAQSNGGGISSSAANPGWLQIGPILIQWGNTASTVNNGGQNISFPRAFSSKPSVTCTPEGSSSAAPDKFKWVILNVTTAGFQESNNGFGPGAIHWIAIGNA